MKKLTATVFTLLASAQTGLCDWHNHHSHSDGGTPNPAFDSFMWTSILIVAASIAILFFVGPVLLIRNRRIRDLFWMVPLANMGLYILSISVRQYPGGFTARFHPPGVTNTVLEFALLLLSSFLVALVLAIIQWIVRNVRRFTKKAEGVDGRPPEAPQPPR